MINIPCSECGCQYCEAITKNGEKVQIDICRCATDALQYDVTITSEKAEGAQYETYRCTKDEIEGCLTSKFNINKDSIKHECFK